MAQKAVELFGHKFTVDAPDGAVWEFASIARQTRMLNVHRASSFICALSPDDLGEAIAVHLFRYKTYVNNELVDNKTVVYLPDDSICKIDWDLDPRHSPTTHFFIEGIPRNALFEGAGKAQVKYTTIGIQKGQIDVATNLFRKLGFRENKHLRIEGSDEEHIASKRFLVRANSSSINLEECCYEGFGSDNALGIAVEDPLAVARAIQAWLLNSTHNVDYWTMDGKAVVNVSFLGVQLELVTIL